MELRKNGLVGFVYALATSRLGVAGLLTAGVYVGYTHADLLTKIEYNTTRKNVPVAQGYFTDPAGLCVETVVNAAGAQEVYLAHKESSTRVAISADLLPDNQTVLQRMLSRAKTLSADERASLMQLTHDLEGELLKR